MLKRAFSITLIFIFLTMSAVITPLCNSGYFAYADTNDNLTVNEKSEIALATYVNYRKGWFISGSNPTVIGILKAYIDDFFYTDANTTNIKSYSDFANEITLDNSSGHWKVIISDDGIIFLDHLVKWLLGKNKFPNLYSGGAWGQSSVTTDDIYDGYSIGNSLFYIFDSTVTSYDTQYNIASEHVTEGNLVNGFNSNYIRTQFRNTNPNVDFGSDSRQNTTGINLVCQFAQDVSVTYRFNFVASSQVASSTSNNWGGVDSCPCLAISSSYNVYAQRVNQIRSNGAWYINRNYPNRYCYGLITYNATLDTYSIYNSGSFLNNATQVSDVQQASADLVTNNFDKNDVSDGEEKEFTPQHSADQGSSTIYNYYDNNTYTTEKEFYTTYITNYRNQHTIIESPNNPEPDPDPDPEPDTPGGTTPPWNSSQSGTITPNGNGGYDLSLPDITLPDLNIDWSLSGLTQKFPFSIPFDLLAFFTVLNAEPETPEIQAQVDLGIIDWNIDWSLEEFDGLAALLRNLEFIGFCIALILITRNIIKG